MIKSCLYKEVRYYNTESIMKDARSLLHCLQVPKKMDTQASTPAPRKTTTTKTNLQTAKSSDKSLLPS